MKLCARCMFAFERCGLACVLSVSLHSPHPSSPSQDRSDDDVVADSTPGKPFSNQPVASSVISGSIRYHIIFCHYKKSALDYSPGVASFTRTGMTTDDQLPTRTVERLAEISQPSK